MSSASAAPRTSASTSREATATPAMSLASASVRERDLMQAAIDLAQRHGWLVYHTHDSRRSEPGLPDLLCVRDDKLLAIECKSAKGRVTKAQWRWLRALDRVRQATAIVLRPGDTYDELAELLR